MPKIPPKRTPPRPRRERSYSRIEHIVCEFVSAYEKNNIYHKPCGKSYMEDDEVICDVYYANRCPYYLALKKLEQEQKEEKEKEEQKDLLSRLHQDFEQFNEENPDWDKEDEDT